MKKDRMAVEALVRSLVQTAVELRMEEGLGEEYSGAESETRVLGIILARYLDGSARKIAEAAYAALEDAGLYAESLGLNIVWNATNPGQDDLWVPQRMGYNGRVWN